MNLITSFRSELTKTPRSSTWLLTLLAAALVALLMGSAYDADSAEDLKMLSGDPWNVFFAQGRQISNLVFLPLFIVVVCTLLPQIEYRNNTWKQVLTSPQPLWQVYLARFLLVQVLLVTYLVAFLVLLGASALVVNALYPKFEFLHYSLDVRAVAVATARTWVSVLALSAFQFWLGLRFKSFFVPVGIGFLMWVAGAYICFEVSKGIYADKFFYAYPVLAAFKSKAHLMPFVMWSSVGYTALFLVLGYLDFKFRKVKG